MATVAIALSSSNEKEGTVSPNSVTFTPDNYAAPQMVQITGVDDNLPDGSQNYTPSRRRKRRAWTPSTKASIPSIPKCATSTTTRRLSAHAVGRPGHDRVGR